MHIYRWDLDRTYLDTDIRSVRGMLRSAFEKAEDKRTIPGASALLRHLLDHDTEARATIVSGFPVQMREVLEQKLALDGIRFDSLILKDNLRNITRGRFRAVRGQLGYKLPALLAARADAPEDATESLFGDDAEVDAVIYALYADAVAGRVDADEVTRVMRAGGAYDDQIDRAREALGRLTPRDAVTDIWIHVDRQMPLRTFQRLGPRVRVVFSWLQAALGLWEGGRLGADGVAAVAAQVDLGVHGGSQGFAGLAQDAVRRGIVTADAVRSLVRDAPDLAPWAADTQQALGLLGDARAPRPPTDARDYVDFLEASDRHG